MRRPGKHFKAWSLMIAVAMMAVSLAAVQVRIAPSAGLAIIGSCAGYLAYQRYSESVTQREAGGLTTGPARKAWLLLVSGAVAAIIIGLSDLAFLAGYYGFLRMAFEVIVVSHWSPYGDPEYMCMGGVLGVTLALLVASSLRRTIWSREWVGSKQIRRWLELWPVVIAGLVGLTLGIDEMRERWKFCSTMVVYHTREEIIAHDAKTAALHASLKDWYRYTTWRPWLPIHPESPPRRP
jgi:hypothetical protein